MGAVTTVGAEAVSEREAEVLAALADHLTNAQIAQRLHISVRTVESHVSSLLRKLQVTDRRALAQLAEYGRTTANAVRASGLPRLLTSFVGRTAERVALAEAGKTEFTRLDLECIGLVVESADRSLELDFEQLDRLLAR